MRLLKSWLLSTLLISQNLFAGQVSVAVAGNFFKPLKQLAAQFESESGHHVKISVAATGKLYAQILHGAPFDLFLSADQKRPASLIEKQFAKADSQFTYAQGQLVLWSKNSQVVDKQGNCLFSPTIDYLAIANPKTAPYGEQSINVLKNLGAYSLLSSKLVQGQNIGQTYQYLSSGSIEMGIIALSQVTEDGQINQGSYWLIPETLYQPIKQDAVLLKHGQNNQAALAFLHYLTTPAALQTIRDFGYKVAGDKVGA